MTDLFGSAVEEKSFTSAQRMSTRQANFTGRDLYTTNPADIERFITAARRDCLEIQQPVWEPAAGYGDISKILMRHGYNVYSSDLYPYHDKDIQIDALDFLTCKELKSGIKTVFTNPPFNTQEEFLVHALSFGIDAVFFVRLSFLSSIRRLKLFNRYNPAYVYVYSARAHCCKHGHIRKDQNMIDYCIIIWKPPYKNRTDLRWIV